MKPSRIDLEALDKIESKDFYIDDARIKAWREANIPENRILIDRQFLDANHQFRIDRADNWMILCKANLQVERKNGKLVFTRQDMSKRSYALVRLVGVKQLRDATVNPPPKGMTPVEIEPLPETLLLIIAE